MNSFLFVLQFRMCQSRRGHHFIAVSRELIIFPNTIFWAHEMNYETFL